MIDDCRSYCYSEMELNAMVDAKMTFIRPSNIGILHKNSIQCLELLGRKLMLGLMAVGNTVNQKYS